MIERLPRQLDCVGEASSIAGLCRERFCRDCYAQRFVAGELRIITRSPLSKPEVIRKSLHYVALVLLSDSLRSSEMNTYYEKHSPRAQRSPTLVIPHKNTPLGPVGPIPSSPVPSSPGGSEAEVQTAPALLLLSFLFGRRSTSTPRR